MSVVVQLLHFVKSFLNRINVLAFILVAYLINLLLGRFTLSPLFPDLVRENISVWILSWAVKFFILIEKSY